MSESHNLTLCLWFLVEGETTPFTVEIKGNKYVTNLKERIHKAKKKGILHHVDAADLVLWKLKDPISIKPKDTFTERVPKLVRDFYVELDEVSDRLSTLFVNPPVDHLHIVVGFMPYEGQPAFKRARLSNSEPHPALTPPLMSRKASDPPIIEEYWSPRSATVDALYERLINYRLVQVRGTPGSGKTTLMELLHAHILSKDRNAIVEVIKNWRMEPGTEVEDRIRKRIKTHPFPRPHNHYLLFDNAHSTYWDVSLWEELFKDVVQHRLNGPLAILFCSYGSPESQPVGDETVTPLLLPPLARVSLIPRVTNPSFRPIGLLFTREEFDEALRRFKDADRSIIRPDQGLRDLLFEWTMGHAGAVGGLLFILAREERQKLRDGGTLTTDDFLHVASKTPFSETLAALPNFARGLPSGNHLRNVGIATVFRELLVHGSTINGNSDVEFCHRQGWIHCDKSSEESAPSYTFPSPLHAYYVSCKLIPPAIQCPPQAVNCNRSLQRRPQ